MIEEEERAHTLATFAEHLGVAFHDMDLLDRALTHASTASEGGGPGYNYESLEFLGDAALSLAVAHDLFERAPDRTPGEYSRMRAAVVNRRSLARMAKQIGVAHAIRLGKGEEMSGGRQRDALLEDCVESVIGALYLDQGWAAVREFITRVFGEELTRAHTLDRVWDFKSRLQHHCQALHIPLPTFRLVRTEGPDHKKEFEIEVLLRGESVGRGSGSSKKEAEQNAAKAALEHERLSGGKATPTKGGPNE